MRWFDSGHRELCRLLGAVFLSLRKRQVCRSSEEKSAPSLRPLPSQGTPYPSLLIHLTSLKCKIFVDNKPFPGFMHSYIQETRIAFQHSSAGRMRCRGNLSPLGLFSQTKFQRTGGVLYFFKKKQKRLLGSITFRDCLT